MAFYFLNLYNWKTQNPPFSDMPQALINLLEIIFFTNQPTWDDCRQLSREMTEARKVVMGPGLTRVDAEERYE